MRYGCIDVADVSFMFTFEVSQTERRVFFMNSHTHKYT